MAEQSDKYCGHAMDELAEQYEAGYRAAESDLVTLLAAKDAEIESLASRTELLGTRLSLREDGTLWLSFFTSGGGGCTFSINDIALKGGPVTRMAYAQWLEETRAALKGVEQ